MLSPLQLDQHRFTKLQVEAIPDGQPGAPCQVRTAVSWGHAHDNELSWKVELTVTFGRDDARVLSPYAGEICLAGFFTVSSAWPAQQRQQLVGINGPSMLYGAAREMVLLLTSRCSHGPMTLPTLSFAKGGEGHAGQRDAVVSQEGQRAKPVGGRKKGKVAKGTQGGKG